MPKVYRGIRPRLSAIVVTVNGHTLDPKPSQAIWNYSPTGFNWGYSGSGPAQLALAILYDLTGDVEVAVANYQEFKRQFVAGFGDEWTLTEEEVTHWLSLSQTKAG
jgi:hypothetical protein